MGCDRESSHNSDRGSDANDLGSHPARIAVDEQTRRCLGHGFADRCVAGRTRLSASTRSAPAAGRIRVHSASARVNRVANWMRRSTATESRSDAMAWPRSTTCAACAVAGLQSARLRSAYTRMSIYRDTRGPTDGVPRSSPNQLPQPGGSTAASIVTCAAGDRGNLLGASSTDLVYQSGRSCLRGGQLPTSGVRALACRQRLHRAPICMASRDMGSKADSVQGESAQRYCAAAIICCSRGAQRRLVGREILSIHHASTARSSSPTAGPRTPAPMMSRPPSGNFGAVHRSGSA